MNLFKASNSEKALDVARNSRTKLVERLAAAESAVNERQEIVRLAVDGADDKALSLRPGAPPAELTAKEHRRGRQLMGSIAP